MADQHEFLLTPGNTAIIVAYAEKQINANAYRPSGDTVDRKHQVAFDCVIQEINLKRRRSCSSGTASTTSARPAATSPCRATRARRVTRAHRWDYFHINSVKIDSDHNLIVSGRHTWAFYKVNRNTGATMWQVQTGLTSTAGSTPPVPSRTSRSARGRVLVAARSRAARQQQYRIFDNNSNQAFPPPFAAGTRADAQSQHGTIRRSTSGHINYSGRTMYAGSQGDSQLLPGSHILSAGVRVVTSPRSTPNASRSSMRRSRATASTPTARTSRIGSVHRPRRRRSR